MIEVKNVTKKYGTFYAVEDINFSIKEGEIVGFLGPNGAGKSTTMNMITGFIDPSKGTILVDGNDISIKPKKAKRQIGYMPENVPLYNDLTVKEFITYMAELKMVKKKDLRQQLDKLLKDTGLDVVQNKIIKNLSRGYKQRVSLAGALVGNPKILILDEPTVGLDPKQITEIRNLIKSLGKDHTVILSSHILSEVSQICQKVIIINKGKIVAIDTPENLENRVKQENVIFVTVEDPEDNIQNIKEKIPAIKEITLKKDNEDGTKEYVIQCEGTEDYRKKIFEIIAKEGITIFEMKKSEATLEDAFIQLIGVDDDTPRQEDEKYKEKQEKKEEKRKQKEQKAEEKRKQKEGGDK